MSKATKAVKQCLNAYAKKDQKTATDVQSKFDEQDYINMATNYPQIILSRDIINPPPNHPFHLYDEDPENGGLIPTQFGLQLDNIAMQHIPSFKEQLQQPIQIDKSLFEKDTMHTMHTKKT